MTLSYFGYGPHINRLCFCSEECEDVVGKEGDQYRAKPLVLVEAQGFPLEVTGASPEKRLLGTSLTSVKGVSN